MPDVVQSAEWNRINNLPNISRGVNNAVDLYNMFKKGGTEDQRRQAMQIAATQSANQTAMNQANVAYTGAQREFTAGPQTLQAQAAALQSQAQADEAKALSGVYGQEAQSAAQKRQIESEEAAGKNAPNRAAAAGEGYTPNWNHSAIPTGGISDVPPPLTPPPQIKPNDGTVRPDTSLGSSFNTVPPPTNTNIGNNPDAAPTKGLVSDTTQPSPSPDAKSFSGNSKGPVNLSSLETNTQASATPPPIKMSEGGIPGSEKLNDTPRMGNPPVSMPTLPALTESNSPLASMQVSGSTNGQGANFGLGLPNNQLQQPGSFPPSIVPGVNIPPNPVLPTTHFAQLPPEEQKSRFDYANAHRDPNSVPFTYAQIGQGYDEKMAAQVADALHPMATGDILNQFKNPQLGIDPTKYILPNGTFDEAKAISDTNAAGKAMYAGLLKGNNGNGEWGIRPDFQKGGFTTYDRNVELVPGSSGLPIGEEKQMVGIAKDAQGTDEYKEYKNATEAYHNVMDAYNAALSGKGNPQTDAQMISGVAKEDNPGGVLRLSVAELMENAPGFEGMAAKKILEILGTAQLNPQQRAGMAQVSQTYLKNSQDKFQSAMKDRMATARKLTGGKLSDGEIMGWLTNESEDQNSHDNQTSSQTNQPNQPIPEGAVIHHSASTGQDFYTTDGGKTFYKVNK